ncbi:hypothetical protein P2G88_16085 [Aliiglaciecola sp. CAU 1673]|uniref:DUF6929 family protein n=1 Tax=Aliiglaciecola sp. CAU 1673 TaxID=3032595 RepID=UPI0023DC9B9E|nr:hypothetical protein [Aliiglaciecola sp. CAU 1673]MDF2179771.1 hypothetical protein [Aliiglaciecola sp. CAU 1673]
MTLRSHPALAATLLLPASLTFAASLSVSEPVIRKDLPSASANMLMGERLYVVGDDASFLFVLDNNFEMIDKTPISPLQPAADGRVPGDIKEDMEAMDAMEVHGEAALVILGSGTKPRFREKGIVLALDNSFKVERDLAPLYQQLHQATGFKASETLNIEGLASDAEYVYIFNRGSRSPNAIFRLNKANFIQYMLGQTDSIEHINAQIVRLPKNNVMESTFSGAVYSPAMKKLFFTASMEGDKNEILGSFVGWLTPEQMDFKSPLDLSSQPLAVMLNGKNLINKIESITLSREDENQVEGALAADNDDGTSQFMRFTLSLD